MSVHGMPLREREWNWLLNPLFSSDRPNRHVVLDDALNPAAFAALRSELLSSWARHYRSQPGYVLCYTPSETGIMGDITHQLGEILSRFRPGLEACERWAFLHQRPFEANKVPDSEYVHYQENRAVVFPASTFHSIGPCHFEASTVDSMRCSVSIFFDSREHWRKLSEIKNTTAETAIHEF